MPGAIDVTSPLAVPTAAEDYKRFTNPKLLGSSADAFERVQVSSMNLSIAQNATTRWRTDVIAERAKDIEKIHGLLAISNTLLANKDPNVLFAFYYDATKPPEDQKTEEQKRAAAQAVKAELIKAGVKPELIEVNGPDGTTAAHKGKIEIVNGLPVFVPNPVQVYITRDNCVPAGKQMDNKITELSTNVQQENLELQSEVERMTNTVGLISTFIKLLKELMSNAIRAWGSK